MLRDRFLTSKAACTAKASVWIWAELLQPSPERLAASAKREEDCLLSTGKCGVLVIRGFTAAALLTLWARLLHCGACWFARAVNERHKQSS